jgi:hypothetical protein
MKRSISTLQKVECPDYWGTGKNLEGSSCGLVEVLYRHLLGMTEENHENFVHDSLHPNLDSNWALPEYRALQLLQLASWRFCCVGSNCSSIFQTVHLFRDAGGLNRPILTLLQRCLNHKSFFECIRWYAWHVIMRKKWAMAIRLTKIWSHSEFFKRKWKCSGTSVIRTHVDPDSQ